MVSSICWSSQLRWAAIDAATVADAVPDFCRLISCTLMALRPSQRRISSRSSRRWAAGGIYAVGRCARQKRAISAASSLSVLFRASSLCP